MFLCAAAFLFAISSSFEKPFMAQAKLYNADCTYVELKTSQKNGNKTSLMHLVVETQKWKKSLKSHRIGKITTQQARTHHVNKVRRFLLRISTSIYLPKSITWIPIQILYKFTAAM